MDQLSEQLRLARIELAEAQKEYSAKIQAARDHFDSEVASMRTQLSDEIASLHQLRASMMNVWTRRESDRLQ
jgi:hypothetical protein